MTAGLGGSCESTIGVKQKCYILPQTASHSSIVYAIVRNLLLPYRESDYSNSSALEVDS